MNGYSNIAAVLPRMTRRVTTYGLDSAAADIAAVVEEVAAAAAATA